MQQINEQQNTDFTTGARIAIILAAISFGLYLFNVLIGKATIVYGWKIFYFDDLGEFLILLAASISFIAAALLREAAWKSNNEPGKN